MYVASPSSTMFFFAMCRKGMRNICKRIRTMPRTILDSGQNVWRLTPKLGKTAGKPQENHRNMVFQ